MEERVLDLNRIERSDELVACIGYFDGFHLGHQSLFNQTLYLAKKLSKKSCIISFDTDPVSVLRGTKEERHITKLEDRKLLAKELGFDVWVSIRFDINMARQEPENFMKMLFDFGVVHLVCGFDFRFGNKGAGNTAYLKSLESDTFSVTVLEEYKVFDEKVSSTRIRNAIAEGDMELSKTLLGRYYSLKGKVLPGRQIGRTIGYPTANIAVDEEYILPKLGVYIGELVIDGIHFKSMMSVGYNLTVKEDHEICIEAHILDFEKDIYGLEVEFIFMKYLRPEEKFDTLDELMDKLHEDEEKTRFYFREKKQNVS